MSVNVAIEQSSQGVSGRDSEELAHHRSSALERLEIPSISTDLGLKWELDKYEPKRCEAGVFYMKPDELYDVEKPYFMNIPIDPAWPPAIKQTNVRYTRKTIIVCDIRGHVDEFTLDRQGFQLRSFETRLVYDDFASTDSIVSRYYQEVKDFLLNCTGASDVLPFDFQVRRTDPSLPVGSRGAPGRAQPFGAVHGDQTAKAAIRRLHYFHSDYASQYAGRRFQIVNVWKPLRGPVYDSPLALGDYRTVQDDDRVPCDIIFPDYLGETYNFWPNPRHRFYYIDRQMENEAWMIKCFDSETAKDPRIAQFTPHVSFNCSTTGGVFVPRESIEVRAFVFY